MRIAQTVLKKVVVKENPMGAIELINVQTGEVDERIPTSKQYIIQYDGHQVTLQFNASYDNKTLARTNVDINFKKLNIYSLAALFTVYKQVLDEHEHDYDAIDLSNLHRQQDERNAIHEQVIKEEKKYEKQLLMAELKRLAKENVDKRKPPVTAALPKTVLAIETSEE